jgi:hypothetical protein
MLELAFREALEMSVELQMALLPQIALVAVTTDTFPVLEM